MKLTDHFKNLNIIDDINEKIGFFDSDMEYIIKDGSAKNTYIVTSWSSGKQPKNIYTLTNFNKKWSCNCPTKTPYCKHIDMVKDYIKQGKPNMFLDATVELEFDRALKRKGIKI